MTKDTTDTSQFSQSSQHLRQGPTKLQKDLKKIRIGHRSEHHVEQGALMSPNPSGLFEVLVVGCVCLLCSLNLLIHSN